MIYLDLDGPMVRWTEGVFELFDFHPKIKPGQTASQALGISKDEMWSRIKKAGPNWWANLKPQPWAQEFYNSLTKIDEVVVLTSPSNIPSASAGKILWMQKFFGPNFNDYIITSKKELLAKPNDVLIDDHDDNIEKFIRAGGVGVTFPRMWNKEWRDTKNPLERVNDTLSQLYPKFKPSYNDDDIGLDWTKEVPELYS